MNRDELRQSLRQPYDRENWTHLVRSVFGSHVRLNKEAQALPTDDDSIKSIAQIGDVLLDDGKSLAVIEVEVGDDINLLRNRVSLRNRVAKFIDQDRAHGVLAVFNSSRPEYRFSFTARETIFDEEVGMVEKETATKRFTYVLGPAETCNTAAERFDRLSRKTEQIRMEDVVEAFSVEKLNKEFFNTYKDHYERFCAHLLSDQQRNDTYRIFSIPKVNQPAEQARLEKPVRDFVKRLLGRVVFLHFLQKKGWMGCPTDRKDWAGGDPTFLQSYFQQTGEKEHFHSQRLLPLFYEALNQPNRPGHVFPQTGTRIPYLNGGLFEPMVADEVSIEFPAVDFDALLNFFGQYNFTIDENDPDEHEVGIDPEMLGHIFENLLEDNKDKGAYYTPKAIVHYMSQQSLIYYLLRHLGESEESKAAITYLVRNKQIGEGTAHAKYIKAHAAEMESLLDEVKICDPAIGSGAFPIGLLQEIFWLKLTLDMTLNQPEQLAEIKRSIIQNSIYGVDKDAGAVDIARLRFWLALVVDETEPRPLPNLDYKIMQGDSLLESFEGVPLDNLMTTEGVGGITISPTAQAEMNFASGQMQLTAKEKVDKITALMRDYYDAESPAEKQRIHNEIDTFVLHHIDYNLSVRKEELETELHQHRAEIRRKQEQLPSYSPTKMEERRIADLEKSIADLGEKKNRLEALEHEAERPYFLWHLFFQDVFANGGFDIVIANPPYVRQEVLKDYKPLLDAEGYTCFVGRADLFVYFYERSLRMLKTEGVLTYITSNKYFRAGYGEKLRNYLSEKLSLRELLDFGDAPVFDAIAYASILIGTKEHVPSSHSLKAWTWQRGEKISQIARVMAEKAFALQQSSLTPDGWRLEHRSVFSILSKAKAAGANIGQFVDNRIFAGIKTGLNEAFLIDYATRSQLLQEDPKSETLIKPYIRGKDIKKWHFERNDRFIIFSPRGTNIDNYPAIKKHLSTYREKLENRALDQKWFELQQAQMAFEKYFKRAKIVYPNVSLGPRFAMDEGSYMDMTTFGIDSSEWWLLGILNSNVINFFFLKLGIERRGGYQEFKTQYVSQIPVPTVSSDNRQKLSNLARRAAESEGASLAAIEAEINQIVYRLFDLTPDEIRLVESTLGEQSEPVISGEHGKTKQKDAFFRRLRELADAQPYLSFDQVKETAKGDKLIENEATLKDYLGEAVDKRILHDAGRGWYSGMDQPLPMDTRAIQPVPDLLTKKFPLLPVCCWSTAQLNPYLEHLMGMSIHFVFTETDALPSVAEYLRGAGFQVAENPRGETQKRLSLDDNLVILRPGTLWQDYTDGPYAPWEVLFVQAWQEVDRLGFIDRAEYQAAVGRALERGYIQIASLLAYARKAKIPLLDLLKNDQLAENI